MSEFTLRLPDRLAKAADLASARHGMSRNEFISAACAAAIAAEPPIVLRMADALLDRNGKLPVDLAAIVDAEKIDA